MMPTTCLQTTASLEANKVSKGSGVVLMGSNEVSSQVNKNSRIEYSFVVYNCIA